MILTSLAVSLAALSPQDTTVPSAHPADVFLLAALPDVQAIIATYPKTAVARLLADPELHAAVGQVMRADPVDPIDLLMEQYDQMVGGGEFPPFLDLGSGMKSIAVSLSVPDGDFAAFAQGMNQQGFGDPESDFFTANFGFRLIADFVDEEACAKAARALEAMLAEGKPWNTELETRELFLDGDGGAFGTEALTAWSYVQTSEDDWMDPFMASLTMVAGSTRIAMISGNVEPESYLNGLAAVEDVTAAPEAIALSQQSLGAAPGAVMAEMHFVPFVQKLFLDTEPMVLPLLDIAEGLIGPAASAGIHGGDWRICFDDASGQFITQGIHGPSEAGPLSGLLGAKPLEADAMTLALPEAIAATVTSLDKNVLARLVTDLAADGDTEALDWIEETYGFRPERDIIGNLGDSLAFSLAEIKSPFAAPNLMFSVKVSDPEAFKGGMDGLFRMITEEGADIEVSRKEYKKVATLYEASIADLIGDVAEIPGVPIDLPTLIRPTIAIIGDRAVFTMTAGYAKKEVRRVLALAEEGAVEEQLHQGLASMEGREGATTLTYANWADLIGGVYDMGKALSSVVGAAGDIPFDLTALPDSELITRHFQPTHRVVRLADGRVRHEVRTSFGPELTMTPLIAIFGLTGMARQEQVFVEMPRAVEAIELAEGEQVGGVAEAQGVARSATDAALADLQVALTLYQLDNGGAYPSSLALLTAASAKYPDGIIQSVPKDGWDRAFVYTPKERDYTLYSTGPNGVDETGGGDDIGLD